MKPQFLHKNHMLANRLGSLHFTRSENWTPLNFSCALYVITVEPLLWDTSVQGTPPFSGHKIWSWKNVHIIFVQSVSSIEGTPLFRGKGHFLKRWGLIFHSATRIYILLKFSKIPLSNLHRQCPVCLQSICDNASIGSCSKLVQADLLHSASLVVLESS